MSTSIYVDAYIPLLHAAALGAEKFALTLYPQSRNEILDQELAEFHASGRTTYEVKFTNPYRQKQGESVDILVAQLGKLRVRNECLKFMNDFAVEVDSFRSLMHSLSSEDSAALTLIHDTLVSRIKDATDPSNCEMFDFGEELRIWKEFWDGYIAIRDKLQK